MYGGSRKRMPDSVPFSRPSLIQPSAWSWAQPSARASTCTAGVQSTKMLFSIVQSRPPPMNAARGHLVEHVADDLRAAEHVVQVHAHAAAALEAVDVVQVVVADDRAAHGPVAAGVDRPGVVGLVAHVVDLVELDHVVVAAEADRHVRGVVDQVVRERGCPRRAAAIAGAGTCGFQRP